MSHKYSLDKDSLFEALEKYLEIGVDIPRELNQQLDFIGKFEQQLEKNKVLILSMLSQINLIYLIM